MKTFDIPKSGKRGSVVAFKSRFGQCEREHTPSRKPRTAAQQRSHVGREYCDKFRCLGTLPTSVRGKSDITALYLSKQGMPWPGSKIFLRIVQQVNGWRGLPDPFAAILPRTPPPPSQPRPRRTAAAIH